MKQVYVLRHAPKDNTTGQLTDEGKKQALELGKRLPKFRLVIASDSARTQETAELLTGINPIVDLRAGFFTATTQQNVVLNEMAKTNPYGFTGAFLELQEIEVNVREKAQGLVSLVKELLIKLEPDAKALIVSHDVTMVPAEELLDGEIKVGTFPYLGGFIVDELGKIEIRS